MKKNKNVLKGVQIQGMRLKEDDILVVKHPVDADGMMLYDYDIALAYHNNIKKVVPCNVLSIPSNIDLMKIRKEDVNKIKEITKIL